MLPPTVSDAARELGAVLDGAPARLRSWSEAESQRSRAPGKWSRRQILGHLIDSASNNHQRFVRAALAGELKFPPYEQEGWVGIQKYADEPWHLLVDLWEAYNRHLLHLFERLPADRLQAPCVVEEESVVTLEWLVRDYVRHLNHHLDQLFAGPQPEVPAPAVAPEDPLTAVRQLVAYTHWADGRVFDVLGSLTPAQWIRDLSASHKSVRDTAVHLVSSQRTWLARWQGAPPQAALQPDAYPDPRTLRNEWEATAGRLDRFVESLAPEALARDVTYVNGAGETWRYPLGLLAFHVVNHSTYHRGQVAVLLRQLGVAPPATDLPVFVDERGTAK